MPAIRATGLRKSFRATDGATVMAVDDVDLTIAPGEIVAFLGPNGAGKTTTVDMLLGLTAPDAGTIEVYGTAPTEAVAARPGVRGDADRRTAQRLHRRRDRAAIAALHGRPDRVDVVLSGPASTDLAAAGSRRARAVSSSG